MASTLNAVMMNYLNNIHSCIAIPYRLTSTLDLIPSKSYFMYLDVNAHKLK